MPAEKITARHASIQNNIPTACASQGPVLSGPYCEMFIRIVPNDTTEAGINRDSVGCRKDALKVYG
jgi:hypothetical protein